VRVAIIPLPLAVHLGKKGKRFSLNLNVYRNTYFGTLNDAKVLFTAQVSEQLRELPKLEKVCIRYYLFPQTKRLCDVANICAVVDKFFCDALVAEKVLPDDNYTHLLGVSYEFGEIDPTNPRVEAHIHNLVKEA
jgi:hypothetical protein